MTAGGAKLLDFGVAKFRPAANVGLQDADLTAGGSSADAGSSRRCELLDGDEAHVTRTGTILGTVRYMAPEQIEGREVDARSDLFSFGAVLFEMLTGRRAFDGDSATMIRAAILYREPASVSSLQPLAPTAIDGVVHLCLAKNRDDRWQSAADVVRALEQVFEGTVPARTQAPPNDGVPGPRYAWRWVAGVLIAALTGLGAWVTSGVHHRWPATTPSNQIRSIAVLPFENPSGDSEQEYFADGMRTALCGPSGSHLGSRGRQGRWRQRPMGYAVPTAA